MVVMEPVYGVSVIVPVFCSNESLPILVNRVHTVLAQFDHEIILVDDGSPRTTWKTVENLASTDARVLGIRLGRNAGQHSALLAGIRAARYSISVTIDDDLQNPPEEIPRLVESLVDETDVVYGTPHSVAQSPWRRSSSAITRGLMSSALGATNAAKITSFRAFRTSLRNGFPAELGPSVSIDALLSWSTSNFDSVPVEHHQRHSGRSNYNFRKLLRFALDTATGYSAVPLQVATTMGIAAALFGLGVLAWVLLRLAITGTSVAGFPFLASIITIFAGVQLVTLGIIGEYLARIHFRVMKKPSYFIAEISGKHPPENDQ